VESIRKRALRRSLLQVSGQFAMEEEDDEIRVIAINMK